MLIVCHAQMDVPPDTHFIVRHIRNFLRSNIQKLWKFGAGVRDHLHEMIFLRWSQAAKELLHNRTTLLWRYLLLGNLAQLFEEGDKLAGHLVPIFGSARTVEIFDGRKGHRKHAPFQTRGTLEFQQRIWQRTECPIQIWALRLRNQLSDSFEHDGMNCLRHELVDIERRLCDVSAVSKANHDSLAGLIQFPSRKVIANS